MKRSPQPRLPLSDSLPHRQQTRIPENNEELRKARKTAV